MKQGGTAARQVARELSVSRTTVRKWWSNYQVYGLGGLSDAPRSGAPVMYDDSLRRRVIELATGVPPHPYSHWTHQMIAEQLKVSSSWVGAVLRTQNVRTHTVTGWIHRRDDPDFHSRVAAVEQAVAEAGLGLRDVISLDEKTAVPVRPPTRADTVVNGRRRREFEYTREGVISWYGYQDCRTGAMTLKRAEKMDSSAFVELLKGIMKDRDGAPLSIVMDNGPAHRSKETTAWLSQNPHITVLYTMGVQGNT